MKNLPTLFLDCDGVCASFEKLATKIFGMHPDKFEKTAGAGQLWKMIRDYKSPEGLGFFEALELMPDAMVLFNAVRHLKPIILTGCPIGHWAPLQKQRWAARNFPGTKMITCLAREKIQYLENPGDVLVDDKTKFRDVWVAGGGIFVHHTSAEDSIAQLQEIYPIWFKRTDMWTPPKDLEII